MEINKVLSDEFKIKREFADNIIELIDSGNTIPFIARYRKEMTGSCDDQVLREFDERLKYLRNLEERKNEVRNSIIEQDKMTDEIENAISGAVTLAEICLLYTSFLPRFPWL